MGVALVKENCLKEINVKPCFERSGQRIALMGQKGALQI